MYLAKASGSCGGVYNLVAVYIIVHDQPSLPWLATHIMSDKEGSRQLATLRMRERFMKKEWKVKGNLIGKKHQPLNWSVRLKEVYYPRKSSP